MKKSLLLSVACAVAFSLAGCESMGVSGRIKENSAVYESLSPRDQQNIQQGEVELGYTSDMVYMSLGKPSKVSPGANGVGEVWTYNNYLLTNVTASAISANSPGHRHQWSQTNPNTPRNPQSLGSTAPGGPQPGLNVADTPTDTLYITFDNGKVSNLRLKSQG